MLRADIVHFEAIVVLSIIASYVAKCVGSV